MANEKRLIDANALIATLEKIVDEDETPFFHLDEITDEIMDATTVDAVEVIHAEWLYDSGSGKYFCSACGEYALSFRKDTLYGGDLYEVCLTDYCPNCGAKMDGGNENV